MKKADIYLNIMKDEQAYSECFRKLAESNPTTENFLMLGDAYLAIQEPELAVQSYERAMVSSSGDAKLSCRLAQVLVRCHQYAKAIKCYRDSGDEGSLELAELLLKLGQMDKAESALSNLPASKKSFILAKVYEKGGDIERALRTLEAAIDGQVELGKQQSNENFAKINHQMAEYATLLRDFDTAIEYYKRSLSLIPDNPNAQISLAKLYMQVNDWSSCESVCSNLLTNDPNNEPALLMLADLAFRRIDFPTAEKHFCALLDRRPNYWVALARLIEVLRRTARLTLAKPYIEAAALAASSTPADQPPLAYCTGLYHWYSGNTSLAMQKFNEARGDAEWGQQALHNMVEVCIGEPAAQTLLAEMRPSTRDEEAGLQLITAFVRMATEEKQQIERAMIDFTYLANNDAHKVGATLGLAMGYVLQKQSTRARNVLKRVAKSVWQFEQAEHLEKSWLLLADLYIQAGGGGKLEPAIDLLRRVISHNKSSSRAYELLGLIAEKEQKYGEASDHYSEAWKLSGECDPSLGYRLAYNLVKGKRFADAISVCHAVLKLSPDYPRIRKDVLDKALSHLRT
ncbi:hypothetical protein AAG570_000268 [Ranatra chinensis]|uniref:Uncharacterized protein n=1 Tax=Ranatra chinensis TaxID=642074 RepID=A0ABD0YWJ7_9HEMI